MAELDLPRAFRTIPALLFDRIKATRVSMAFASKPYRRLAHGRLAGWTAD
jgi:hypothetical protein